MAKKKSKSPRGIPSQMSFISKAFKTRASKYADNAKVTLGSDARAVIALGGEAAREVLMKGCSLDLHPRVFGPGSCAQSTLALAQIILEQVEDGPDYRLYVGRSFAPYLWQWLCDAAGEFGLRVLAGPGPD